MSAVVQAEQFAGAVAWLVRARGRGPAHLPAFAGIHLRADAGVLRMTARSFDATAETSVPLVGDCDLDVWVSADRLAAVAKALPGEQATIGLDGERLRIADSGARWLLRPMALDTADVPADRADVAEDGWGKVPADWFAEALRQAARHLSDDRSRPVLGTVHLHAAGDVLAVEATGGYTALHLEHAWEGPDLDVALPSVAVAALARPLAAELLLGTSGGRVVVLDPGRRLTLSTVEGNFPNLAALRPDHWTCEVVVPTAALVSAVNLAAAVTRSSLNGRVVVLDIAEGVTVTGEDEGDGSSAAISAAVEGEPLSVGFIDTYLVRAVEALQAARVRLRLIDPLRPMVVTDADGEDGSWAIVMPYRL